MKVNFIILLIVVISFIQTSFLYGQDTSKTIKDILIVENRIPTEFTPSQKVDAQILQYHQHKSLQQLLELHSNVFVKNYGVGSLSTISIRGCSAAQTYVNWHGINLNNAMTGITDFSILPSGLFDEIQINYGSELENTSLGGGLELMNKKAVFRKSRKLSIDVGYESIQNSDMLASYTFSNKYVSNTLKLNAFQGKNQFNYYNTQLDSTITLTHANRKHQHIMNDLSIRMNRKNTLSLHTWIQFTQRQIPAASFEIVSQKEEKISSARNLLIWNSHINQQINVEFLMGYLTEKYSYQDEAIFLRSNTQVNQIPLKFSSNIKPGHGQLIDVEFNANHAYLNNNQHQALT
ncbi:MAG: TonB-dependent receptor plug domain-containing protein, partial [Chitinophagaceae bacterium]|nr:TonB-dependent receptor plug domain-containing protein [Chitinophagaceae bacterium]